MASSERAGEASPTDSETEEALGETDQSDKEEHPGEHPTAGSIEDVGSEEVIAVIRHVFSDGGGRDRETALRDTANALGFHRVGSRIREAIDGGLRAAARRGVVYRERGLYYLDCRSIDDYCRDDLVKYLLAAMGTTWWDRQEAVRSAARYLGFRRAGRNIQAALKSAITAAIRRGLLERDGPQYIRKTR